MFVKTTLPKDFFIDGFTHALNVVLSKVNLSDNTKAYMTEIVNKITTNKRVMNEICCLLRRLSVFNNSQFLNIKEWENELRKRHLARKDIFLRYILRLFKRDNKIEHVERLRMSLFMSKLPRNGLSTRARNRDPFGYPRAYFRRYGASRHTIREWQSCGFIPGLIGASW